MSKRDKALSNGFNITKASIDSQAHQHQMLDDRNIAKRPKHKDFYEIAIDLITDNPYQPRNPETISEDSIDELARSLKEQGLIQPIKVNLKDGKFQLVAGHRRVMAARKNGWDFIPAIVQTVDAKKEDQFFEAMAENLRREGITFLERGRAFEQFSKELKLSNKRIAKSLGFTASYIGECMLAFRLNIGEVTYNEFRALVKEFGGADSIKKAKKTDLSKALERIRNPEAGKSNPKEISHQIAPSKPLFSFAKSFAKKATSIGSDFKPKFDSEKKTVTLTLTMKTKKDFQQIKQEIESLK